MEEPQRAPMNAWCPPYIFGSCIHPHVHISRFFITLLDHVFQLSIQETNMHCPFIASANVFLSSCTLKDSVINRSLVALRVSTWRQKISENYVKSKSFLANPIKKRAVGIIQRLCLNIIDCLWYLQWESIGSTIVTNPMGF